MIPSPAAARAAVFQALRPLCAPLMQLRANASGLHQALTALQAALQITDATGMQGCWDYITLPLLLMVDSIIPSRRIGTAQRGKDDNSQRQQDADLGSMEDAAFPVMQSDRLVEAALGEFDGHGSSVK